MLISICSKNKTSWTVVDQMGEANWPGETNWPGVTKWSQDKQSDQYSPYQLGGRALTW